MQIIDLLSCNLGDTDVAGLKFRVIHDNGVGCWIRLDSIKGDGWALLQVCALQSAAFQSV